MSAREEVHLLIDELPEESLDQARSLLEGLRPPSNDKPRYLALAERLAASIPIEERKQVPADLTSQLDHYIYGTPKT
jgi:hypothetical protein